MAVLPILQHRQAAPKSVRATRDKMAHAGVQTVGSSPMNHNAHLRQQWVLTRHPALRETRPCVPTHHLAVQAQEMSQWRKTALPSLPLIAHGARAANPYRARLYAHIAGTMFPA